MCPKSKTKKEIDLTDAPLWRLLGVERSFVLSFLSDPHNLRQDNNKDVYVLKESWDKFPAGAVFIVVNDEVRIYASNSAPSESLKLKKPMKTQPQHTDLEKAQENAKRIKVLEEQVSRLQARVNRLENPIGWNRIS